MSNLNPNTIENVSITEVKELDEFLKSYNKYRELSETERKQQVLTECVGKITEKSFDKLLEKSARYTLNAQVPTEVEWGQVRAVYREIGNKKIAQSKETLEKLSKEYSGTPSMKDSQYGELTPKQVVHNLERAEQKVETIKTLRVCLSIVAGICGFIAMTSIADLVLSLIGTNESIIIQLTAGLFSLCGLVGISWIVNKLMGAMLISAKRDRDRVEITEANYHNEIQVLQTAIKTAEENVKRVETQYGVEIFAQTDFSSLVQPAKKRKQQKMGVGKEKKEQEQNQERKDSSTIDVNNADSQVAVSAVTDNGSNQKEDKTHEQDKEGKEQSPAEEMVVQEPIKQQKKAKSAQKKPQKVQKVEKINTK